MKPLTEQQIKEHNAASIRGAIEGTVTSGIVAGGGWYYLNRKWASYRSLPISLKVLGTVILVAPCLSIQAERRGLEYDKSQWTGIGLRTIEHKAAEKENEWERLTVGQKVGDWAMRHEYSLIIGCWALSMGVAGAIISRDRYQSVTQKIVQARMWAQGLTIGVLIGAGAITHTRNKEKVSFVSSHLLTTMYTRSDRSAAIAITLFGTLVNFFLTIQVLALWRSVKWESESEWEGSSELWRRNGVQIVGALLSAYFAASAVVSALGLLGIIKNNRSLARFYRDASIADFLFGSFLALVGTFSAFRTCIRTGVCEELSRHPELMRDMLEMGLNVENCELWFERAVMALLAFIIVLSVVRLHFLMAVSNYYSHIAGQTLPLHAPKNTDSPQRIFLLSRSRTSPQQRSNQDDVLVYAPVPLSSLSPQAAQDLRSTATEAWISPVQSDSPVSSHTHSHRHRHHGSSGRISLPIRPDEGLLTTYDEDKVPL